MFFFQDIKKKKERKNMEFTKLGGTAALWWHGGTQVSAAVPPSFQSMVTSSTVTVTVTVGRSIGRLPFIAYEKGY